MCVAAMATSPNHRTYRLGSVGEYFIMNSRSNSLSNSLERDSPPSSGDHGGVWSLGSENLDCFEQRWHLVLDSLRPEQRRTVSQVSIRMWREVCIWLAMEGAFAGRPWGELGYNEVITDGMIQTMLQDRPTPTRGPPRYFSRMEAVPKEYVGHFCIREELHEEGKWYNES